MLNETETRALNDILARHRGFELIVVDAKIEGFERLHSTTRIEAERQRALEALVSWKLIRGELSRMGY